MDPLPHISYEQQSEEEIPNLSKAKTTPPTSHSLSKTEIVNAPVEQKVTHVVSNIISTNNANLFIEPAAVPSKNFLSKIATSAKLIFKKDNSTPKEKADKFIKKHNFVLYENQSNNKLFQTAFNSKYTYNLLVKEKGRQLLQQTKSKNGEQIIRYFQPKHHLGKGGFGNVQAWKEIKTFSHIITPDNSSCKKIKTNSSKYLAIKTSINSAPPNNTISSILNEQAVPNSLRSDGTQNIEIAKGAFIAQTNEDKSVHVSTIHKLANAGPLSKLSKKMNFTEKISAMKQLSTSLARAHYKGIVFLDIKGDNVLVYKNNKAKIKEGKQELDFKYGDLDNSINLNDKNELFNKIIRCTPRYHLKTDIDAIKQLRKGKDPKQLEDAFKQMDVYEQGVTFLETFLGTHAFLKSEEYVYNRGRPDYDTETIKDVKNYNLGKDEKQQIKIRKDYYIDFKELDEIANDMKQNHSLKSNSQLQKDFEKTVAFLKTMVNPIPSKRPTAENVKEFFNNLN